MKTGKCKAKLICLDGLDGAGKKTVAKKLFAQLSSKGKLVKSVSFPMYDKWHSIFVKLYLKGFFGKDPIKINPYVASMFYAIDRFLGYRKYIKPYLNTYDYILLDRYTTSNMIFQAAKGRDIPDMMNIMNFIIALEYKMLKIKNPDYVFILDTNIEQTIKNISNRNNKKDIHETIEFQELVDDSLYLGLHRFNWIIIDTLDNSNTLRLPTEIASEIIKKIEGVIA